jgi:hypothetical protein
MTTTLFFLTLGAILILIGRTIEAPRTTTADLPDSRLLRDLVAGVVVLVHVSRAYADSVERFAAGVHAR